MQKLFNGFWRKLAFGLKSDVIIMVNDGKTVPYSVRTPSFTINNDGNFQENGGEIKFIPSK